MSGQLLVEPPDAPDEKHLHARFDFADDGPQLRFVDQRTFGGMALADLASTSTGIPPPECPRRSPTSPPTPRGRATTSAAVVRPDEGTRVRGVKRALLDQSLVSGIGNIYADEALWRAADARRARCRRAHPARRSAGCSATPAT